MNTKELALALDLMCWVGASVGLWFYGYPTAAAITGATGIMYLRHAFTKYKQMKYNDKFFRDVLNHIDPETIVGGDPKTILFKEFDSEEEMEKFIVRYKEDPEAMLRELEEELKPGWDAIERQIANAEERSKKRKE